MSTEPRHRPFPVTILAILALIAAALAVVHLLQALGIVPYVIGPISIRDFNLILNFFAIIGSNTSFSDVGLSFLINAAILIYCLLPGTKAAFGMERP